MTTWRDVEDEQAKRARESGVEFQVPEVAVNAEAQGAEAAASDEVDESDPTQIMVDCSCENADIGFMVTHEGGAAFMRGASFLGRDNTILDPAIRIECANCHAAVLILVRSSAPDEIFTKAGKAP